MSAPECESNLATRPLLYTDTLAGVPVGRDDLWAVNTAELNAMADRDDVWREKKRVLENDLGTAWEENERLRGLLRQAACALDVCGNRKEADRFRGEADGLR